VCEEIVARVEVRGLLVLAVGAGVIAYDFPIYSPSTCVRSGRSIVMRPTSATGKNLATQPWSFEASAFEDDGAAVAVGSRPDVSEGLHVAFEVEEELERWHWELVIWFRPLGVI
jgi:hypothetical protein